MASVMKGTGVYLTKRGCDEMTSSFVATRTNLFPSHYMTHTEDVMESSGSKQFSLTSPNLQISNTERRYQ